MKIIRNLVWLGGTLLCTTLAFAQVPAPKQIPWPDKPQTEQPAVPTDKPAEIADKPAEKDVPRITGRRLASYVLGPGDELTIMSVQAPEIANKPIPISNSGDIALPMVGRVMAAGRTLDELQTEVVERLKTYIKEPDVAISLSKMKSQPVSILGAVGAPGVHQLEGSKTLVEVLAMAGGLKQDGGSRVKITRKAEYGPIPLPNATVEGNYSTAEVNIRSIENATSPDDNIEILPYDVITVPRAEMVYVIGEGVRQPGAFALNDKQGISIIQAFARAQGSAPAAGLKSAKIYRPVPNSERIEIAVNLDDILKGKGKDTILQPDDILYVPKSEMKGTARRTLDSVLQMTTGLMIYRW